MVIDTRAAEIVRFEVELEVGFGGDGLEDADGLGGDFRACEVGGGSIKIDKLGQEGVFGQ